MITKKAMRSSRFYSTVMRKSANDMTRRSSAQIWKQRMFESRRAQRARLAHETVRLSIPPIETANHRHQRVQKQGFFSFIPRSARAIANLFKKGSA